MKGIILAGGFGTRLNNELVRKEDKNKPKALLKINGKPLIEHILDRMEGLVDEVYVITNNIFYEEFEKLYGDRVVVVNNNVNTNEERLGSVGDLKYVIDKAGIRDDMLVVGGDNYFDFDLKIMVGKFNKTKSSIIALYDVGDLEIAKRMGVPRLDGDRVKEFIEKPEIAFSPLVGTLIYVIAFQDIPLISECIDKGLSDRAGDFISYLTQESVVYSVRCDGKWFDIGDNDTLERARGSLDGM